MLLMHQIMFFAQESAASLSGLMTITAHGMIMMKTKNGYIDYMVGYATSSLGKESSSWWR